MSIITELDPWKALQSHKVNCNKGCSRKKVACPVGRLLLAKAMQVPEESHRPMSFPFVARILERVQVNLPKIGWIEAVVMEKSIQPREMYQRTSFEDGTTTWRTGSDKLIGYEVETDDRIRHYVRPYQIKSMRPKREQGHGVQSVSKTVGVGSIPPAPANDDLIIIRRA